MNLKRFKNQINSICVEYDVDMLGVFGSVARGEDVEGSDVDLLVRFKRPVGLIELIRIEDRFEAALGRQVDLGTEGSLHPLIRDNVMGDLQVLYEG